MIQILANIIVACYGNDVMDSEVQDQIKAAVDSPANGTGIKYDELAARVQDFPFEDERRVQLHPVSKDGIGYKATMITGPTPDDVEAVIVTSRLVKGGVRYIMNQGTPSQTPIIFDRLVLMDTDVAIKAWFTFHEYS